MINMGWFVIFGETDIERLFMDVLDRGNDRHLCVMKDYIRNINDMISTDKQERPRLE